MDDLTQIPGIGIATAKRLHEAGYDSFATLGAASAEALIAAPALQGQRGLAEAAPGWIAAAADMAGGAAQNPPAPDHDARSAGKAGGDDKPTALHHPVTELMARRVLSPVDLDGVRHDIGARVMLSPEIAAELDAAGATGPVESDDPQAG